MKMLTPYGGTVTLNHAPEHLGEGVILALGMMDPEDNRRAEIFLDADCVQLLNRASGTFLEELRRRDLRRSERDETNQETSEET